MPATAPKTLSRVKAQADARHLMRYLNSKAGIPLIELAKRENVSVKTIQESIRTMEAYESRNSEGQLQLAVRDMIISLAPQAKESLSGLMLATTTVEKTNPKTGQKEYISEPDKITRLESLKVYNGMVAAAQPKVSPVSLSVSQNNNNQTAVLSAAETTEERLRRLKASAAEHNLLPPVVIGVPETIDRGFDPDEDQDEDDE
jgi:hypothetical protein